MKRRGKSKVTLAVIAFPLLFSLLLLSFSAAFFILPEKSFSKKENRPLSPAPVLSLHALASGDHFKEFGDFFSDRFPLRDTFTSAYALFELALGKKEVNGILKADGGVLISLPDLAEEENRVKNAKSNLAAVAELEKDLGAVLFVVPQTAAVFSRLLPKSYPKDPIRRPEELLTGQTKRLYSDYLSAADASTNYKTDHHWTTKGAYFAYTQLAEVLGYTPFSENDFDLLTVSESFYGSSAAASGLPHFCLSPDSIALPRYPGDENVRVINRETGAAGCGFYCPEALGSSDEYRIFLGGNYSHLTIESEEEKSGRLLLIKDSFANSIIPFLARHYDIEVIDPRYCSVGYCREITAEDGFDRMLILLGYDTLSMSPDLIKKIF